MGRLRVFALALPVLFLAASAAPASAQVDPKTALLEKAGWDALRAGQAHVAADDFRQALDADPQNARLLLGAGTAAFLERRDADAKDALQRALSLDPTLADAERVLGQVLHRSGDLQGAIRTYEALTTAAPGEAEARDTLARWRREAEIADRMQQAVGSHFTVSFDGPAEAALATEALASLDRAYWRIGSVLTTYPNEPIPVVLYTTEQFRDVTRSPGWAAGAFDGTIRVPMRGALDDPKELDRVLAHEFTHAVVRLLAPRNVPTWLNEGLAAALETGDVGWADSRSRDAQGTMPLSALAGSFGRLSGDQATLAYAFSALAVRRLIQDNGGFAVANLLRDLGEGADFDQPPSSTACCSPSRTSRRPSPEPREPCEPRESPRTNCCKAFNRYAPSSGLW